MRVTRRLKAAEVCRLRLASQFLVRPLGGAAADLVRALGAVQAQDFSGAKWAVAQRIAGGTDARVEADMAAGTIVRTHVLRPTWHFVAAEDLRWMLALSAPRIAAAMASYNRTLGLTGDVFRRSTDAIARALEGGQHLTRRELRTVLDRAGITASGQRLARLVMQAELDAVVCSGPRRGTEFTYALVDDRVPPTRVRDRDESLADLATRYFATRGPASPHDFAWWSGLAVADAKRAIQLVGPVLEPIDVDGRSLWRHRGQEAGGRRTPMAHLLPNYDEYFIGLRDRSAIAGRVGGVELVSGGDALTSHVALVNGELVGAWKRAVDARQATVSLRLAARITEAERRLLERQGERLGTALGLPTGVRFTGPARARRRVTT